MKLQKLNYITTLRTFNANIILARVSNLVLFDFAKKSMVYYLRCETEIKVDPVTTNKASYLKTKNTPQNSRKQSGMTEVQEKPHL